MTRPTTERIANFHIPEVPSTPPPAGPVKVRERGDAAGAAVPLPEAATVLPDDPLAFPGTRAAPAPEEALEQLQAALARLKRADDGKVDVYLGDYSEMLRYIGSVLIKNADVMRQHALSDRIAARQAARGALLGQADKLHEAAEKARTLAIISLVVVVALSVTTLASSAFSLRNSYQEIKIGHQKNKDLDLQNATVKNLQNLRNSTNDPEMSERLAGKIADAEAKALSIAKTAEKQLSSLRQKSRYADAASQASSSGSNVMRTVEGIQQAGIKATEADATLLSAHAQFDMQQADLKKELYDKIIELIQQSITMYRNLQQSQAESMRALTRS